jgi:hypothetical protein
MENSKSPLATLGMSQTDLGAALIEEANRLQKKRMIESATAEVTRLMTGIEAMEASIKRDRENLEIYNSRLDAINAGKFRVVHGNSAMGTSTRLVYEEDRLNKVC